MTMNMIISIEVGIIISLIIVMNITIVISIIMKIIMEMKIIMGCSLRPPDGNSPPWEFGPSVGNDPPWELGGCRSLLDPPWELPLQWKATEKKESVSQSTGIITKTS